MKHTSGPWVIETTEDSHFILNVDSVQIAQLDAIGPQSFSMPNARLISAAPDLLKELYNAQSVIQSIIDHMRTGEPWSESMIDDLTTELIGMRIVIAKAKGEF